MPYSPWPQQKCLSFSKVRKSKVDQSHITAKRKWQQSLVFRKGYIAWKNVRGLKAFERQKSSTHLNFSLSDRNSCQIYSASFSSFQWLWDRPYWDKPKKKEERANSQHKAVVLCNVTEKKSWRAQLEVCS